MRNDRQILASASDGYFGRPNDAMWSSPRWLAYEAGKALKAKGSVAPELACTSRGYSIRIETKSGNEFLIRFSGPKLATVDVERLAV